MERVDMQSISASTKKCKAYKPVKEKKRTEVKRNCRKGKKNSDNVMPHEPAAKEKESVSPSSKVVNKEKRRCNEVKNSSIIQSCEAADISSEKGENENIPSSNLQSSDVEERILEKDSKYLNAFNPSTPESNIKNVKNDSELDKNQTCNKDKRSQDEAVGLISEGVSMLNLNFSLIDQKMKERKRVASFKTNKQSPAPLPSFRDLSEANRVMHVRQVFEFVFNYNMLSYRGLYKADLSQWTLNENIDNSLYDDEDVQELNELFLDSDFINQFNKYENAINKLIIGDLSRARESLLELVNSGIQPAFYALAVIIFKEISVKYNIYDGKDIPSVDEDRHNIEIATKLLKRADQMSPANYFLLGMICKCNIGKCYRFIDEISHENLIHVVSIARALGLMKLKQNTLMAINFNSKLHNNECGIGMRKKLEVLVKMANYSLYEITQDVLSEKQFRHDVLNSLFAAMPKNFSEGLYSYGLALIQGKINGSFQENMIKAKRCLSRAISLGHEGAKFLFGILPLRSKTWSGLTNSEVKRCISELEDYISRSDDSCFINKENVDKVVFFLALEYNKHDSKLVQYKPEFAKEMLRLRGLKKCLKELQQKTQLLVKESVLSDKNKINFAPKFASTGIERQNSSSGVETMLNNSLSDSPSSSATNENGIVFGSTEHSTFHTGEQKKKGRVARQESSGWRRV